MNVNTASFTAWQTYLKERSPLPVIASIAFFQSLSSNYLFRAEIDGSGVTLSTLCLTLLLILMRLMDEIKDYQKDLLAHPTRPLPRGLITPGQVQRVIHVLTGGLLTIGVLLLFRSVTSGEAFILTVAYLLLMYKEFFCSEVINKNAFIYAISHQIILIPMYFFSVAMTSPEAVLSQRTLWFSLAGLGASFAYEVGRKLNPGAHPVLQTYRVRYGKTPSVIAISVALCVLSISAMQIGVHILVWPVVGLLILLLPLVYIKPEKFKLLERICALVVMIQLLSVSIMHFL